MQALPENKSYMSRFYNKSWWNNRMTANNYFPPVGGKMNPPFFEDPMVVELNKEVKAIVINEDYCIGLMLIEPV